MVAIKTVEDIAKPLIGLGEWQGWFLSTLGAHAVADPGGTQGVRSNPLPVHRFKDPMEMK